MSTPMSPGIEVSGGGSIAVDTPAMASASRLLEDARADLWSLAGEVDACLASPAWAGIDAEAGVRARAALGAALAACRRAAGEAEAAATGLRTAAIRYGAAEAGVADVVRVSAAAAAAATGSGLVLAASVLGPVVPAVALIAAGPVALGLVEVAVTHSLGATGRADPQVDPAVLAVLRVALSSSDDLLRGLTGAERPADALLDDPAAPLGSRFIAAAAAGLLPVPAGALSYTAGPASAGSGPRSLAELADRIPESKAGEPQIRIEEYRDDDGGRRWAVYLTGTVTFAPDPGDEPFDLRSDLLGVAGRSTDSTAAVLGALRRAGIAATEPVLLVGHSQGALDATRIAESGGYAVAGVVTLGGPTGQIALPASLPVLAVEHAEDPVPVLGGLAAGGGAGLRRLVVRRRLYASGPPPGSPLVPFSAGAAPHAVPDYRATLALADRSADPRIAGFERRIAPFLSGRTGSARLVRVHRRLRPPDPLR